MAKTGPCAQTSIGMRLILLPVLLALATPGLAQEHRFPAPPSAADLELYAVQCSPCHGQRGRGDGVAGRFLLPVPRNLREDQLRFVSGANSRARREDVARTIREGLAGTSMLAYRHLGEERIDRLTAVVEWFRAEGARSRMASSSPDRALARALEELAPGPRLQVPAPPPNTALLRAEGRLAWSRACASCHGPLGRGDGPQELKDAAGRPVRARDLSLGVLKGGTDPERLFRRIRLGLPGSPMPAFLPNALSDREIWSIVHWLGSVIPPAAQSLSDTTIKTIPVPYREGSEVPRRADDPRFVGAARFHLPLAPFRTDVVSVTGIVLDLFHDGELVHMRARWSDPTRDIPSPTRPFPPDGLAARVTDWVDPPVLPIPGLPLPLDRALWLAGDMPEAEDPVFDGIDPRFENPDGVCVSPIGPERIGHSEWISGVWTVVLSVRPDRGGRVKRGGQLSMSWSVFDGAHRRGPMPVAFSNWTRLSFE